MIEDSNLDIKKYNDISRKFNDEVNAIKRLKVNFEQSHVNVNLQAIHAEMLENTDTHEFHDVDITEGRSLIHNYMEQSLIKEIFQLQKVTSIHTLQILKKENCDQETETEVTGEDVDSIGTLLKQASRYKETIKDNDSKFYKKFREQD